MNIKTFKLTGLWFLMLSVAMIGSGDLAAQSITDSVFQVPAVVIRAPRYQHFRNDVKTEVFSGEQLSMYAGEPLHRFLSQNTALNIKSYGAGGALANVVLRGTSSSHVQVNWNGFPINSVTLGSFDFSMVPSGGFDRVSIVYGASGALYGSGTFGGAVNLDSDLKLEKSIKGSAQVSYESLKTLNGSSSFLVGNDKVVWKINAWGATSENEFTYYDYIRQSRRKQSDGEWNDAGFIQNAMFKISPSSTLEAGMWYQVKSYNIPSRIGSASYEHQKDSTLRLFVAYKTNRNRWGLQVKSALFNDDQKYWQKASAQAPLKGIESQIAAHQWYGDADFRYYLHPGFSIDAGAVVTYAAADISVYRERKEETGVAAFTGLKYDKKRLSWQAVMRAEWSNNFHSGLLPSLGIEWQMVPDNWTLRANISQKFRKPTFNDRYWVPGGNPGLKPENGYSIETGASGKILDNENSEISTDLSLYWSEITDMIVWRPAGAYWMARNYQRVHTAGMEARLLYDIHRKKWKYHTSLMLTLNRSMAKVNAGEDEEVMAYSPRVITTWENRFELGIMEFSVWHHFTADRFYDDNGLLDPYQTIDAQAGIKIPLWKGKFGVHSAVNNLTDTDYELIRLYPMPGRYWSVKISYTF